MLAKKQKLPASCKAAWKGDVKKLKKALKKSDVNEIDKDLRTPLHYACAQGHDEAICFLLATGSVNPNICDNEGKTALIKSCECNQATSAQLLVDHNFNPMIDFNLADKDGNSPLIFAVSNDNVDISSLLVISGADVNHCNSGGESPLIIATRKNNHEIVELLGSESADLNVVDNEGRTPLMMAVKSNHVSIVKYLLSLFPNTTMKDKHGWTAFDFAQICADNTCLRLLEDHDKKCDNPEYNPEHDNITTINSQDEAVNHKNSANDWTAPPDGDLTEDDSFMSSPIELNGTMSPDIPMNKSTDDIEIDVDQVFSSSDKSVSEVDLSMSHDKGIEPDPAPGAAVNRLLEVMNKTADLSEGQVELGANASRSPSPGTSPCTDDNSLGQVSNINDDESSVNLSSEDIGYIPTIPMPDSRHEEDLPDKNELKLDFGFDFDAGDQSCTTQSGPTSQQDPPSENDKTPEKSEKGSPKRLPTTPRRDSSEGSTPKASPRGAGYLIDDDDSTLSSITEKTEPVASPELGEVISPDPISPLPENTLSDSISLNSDVEISGYLSESVRSSASGRNSPTPKGDTPSDFRMTPYIDEAPRSDRSDLTRTPSISSGVVVSTKRTPPQTPPSNRSSIADGVKKTKITPTNSLRSEPKLHFGGMDYDDSDSEDASFDDSVGLNKSGHNKPDKSKSVDINDLSVVSQSKSSLTDRNILNSARSSPTRLKPDFSAAEKRAESEKVLEKSKDESISEDITSGISDDEAELLLAKSSDLLLNYITPVKEEATMEIDMESNDVRVPAAFAPDSPAVNNSFEDNIMKPKLKSKQEPFCEADVTMEDSSSDESETGKLAKKYLTAKKSRETPEIPAGRATSSSNSPNSPNSNYCSSVSPMEGECLEQKSVPTSKHVTPRVSFGSAPICFAEPDRTSTPKKEKKDDQAEGDEEIASTSEQQSVARTSPGDPALSAKYEDIERRKSEAERELQEIRKSRRSQSPCSLTESYATDSRNVKSADIQRAASEESINSLIDKEEMPVDVSVKVTQEIQKDLKTNPNIAPSARAEANMSECATALSEAVSYIQTNLDIQSNPQVEQLQEQLKETKHKLHRVTESKNKSDTLRKQLEIETEELRRKIDATSSTRTNDDKSRMDMELDLRSLKLKYEHELEERASIESQYRTSKENLQHLESKHKLLVSDHQAAELAKKQLEIETNKYEHSQKQYESEISELKIMLEEEQKTRLIQEEMFNDQVNRSRDLSSEASKNIRQKQDFMQQLTEAEEVCRNAENRNKNLLNDLSNLKAKHEEESKKWAESESEMKTCLQKLESSVNELSGKTEIQSAKLGEKDSTIKDLEEKLRTEISNLTLSQHGFDLKENELKTSNKQFSDEIQKMKVDFEKTITERDIKQNKLVEMEGKLKMAEEIGTASANEQINVMNHKIGEVDAQLKFKTQQCEETARKLRNAEEEVRQLALKFEKEAQIRKMKEESLCSDTDHLIENVAEKDEKIKILQIEVGELEEKLLHSSNKVKDVQLELNETNRLILDKTGAILTNAERDQVKEKYVSSMEEQLQKEREKFALNNHELEMLKCKFEHLSEDKKSLEMQVDQMTESLQMRDDSVNLVNEKLTETRSKFMKENDKTREELKKKNEALQEHMSELRQNLVSAEAAKDMGEIEISRLKQEVKQQASSIRVKEDMFKQQKSSLEAKNTELCEEIKKIEKKLQELYTDRLHLKNELSNTKDKLDAEITLRKDVERKLDSMSLSNSTLNNDLIELKGNHDREAQNKAHYQDLYKSEQDYTTQLKDELTEAKKNVASLESLNDTLRNTVEEFKDSHREEKMGRTLASKELDETRQMLENEIKTRSHIGGRITSLEHENQDLNNSLHVEQKKVKKAAQSRKVAEANVDALQANMTDLHKDIG